MENVQVLKEQICLIGKRLYDHKLCVANDGNISCRLDSGLILITPTRMCKADVKPEDILTVDMDGRVIEGSRRPSTEAKMHLCIYKERADVNAVVHAHPPIATGFALARQGLMSPAIASAFVFVGPTPCAEYGTPSTEEVPDSIMKYIKDHDCIFLANHGTVTAGRNLEDAFFKTERLELLCTSTLVARLLGGECNFNGEEVNRLLIKKERQRKEGLL